MSITKTIRSLTDNAPEVKPFVNSNLGRLQVTPFILSWRTDENGKRMPERRELTEDYQLQPGESFELQFSVDIQEFNPALNFKYERSVAIRRSNREVDPPLLTDWSEIIEPSLVSVFGPNWLDSIMEAPYVEVEDAPNIAGRRTKPKEGEKDGKIFGVPKFLRKFASRADCEAAHSERFGKDTSAVAVPPAVITKVKNLLVSLKGDRKKVGSLLAKKPFGDYDVELLLTLAEVP